MIALNILTSTKHWQSLPDATLIHHARKKETKAFEAIMRRYNQRLFRTARSILNHDADAEDAVQEAYLKAWQSLHNFKENSLLSTWLTRIVINESLSKIRKHTKANIIPLDAVNSSLNSIEDMTALTCNAKQPEHNMMQSQLKQILEQQIDRLPENFRIVFILKAIEELPIAEIATILDIPEATVRSRFFRAKSILRSNITMGFDLALEDVFSFDGLRCDRIVDHVMAKIH